jgi:outer membrane protein
MPWPEALPKIKMLIVRRKLSALLAIIIATAFSPHSQTAETRLVEGQTLDDFMTAALVNNPQLQIAEEQLNIFSARKRAATGQLLPQVNANANLTDNRRSVSNQIQNFDGERFSVQLTQTLFNWQAFASRRRANASVNQAESEYFNELATLMTEVAESYFDVLQAEDALESIASEQDAVRNQLEQVQSLYDRQLAQVTDLYQAQASVASVQAEQLKLEAELALARDALQSVSGIQVGDIFSLQSDVDVPPLDGSIQYWVQLAKENNPLIQSRRYAVEAAEENISEKQGAYMPRVTFIAQRQDSNVGFDNAPQSRTDNTYIGVDVSIPLYAGGSNKAAVSEARSQRNIAESELRQVQLEASERVRGAYLQAQASSSLVEAAEVLVDSTAVSAEAMQRGFSLGTVTSVDVLNAIRDQYRAERDLQRARYEQIKYMLILKREAGTLDAEDIVEVGNWLEETED